MTKLQEWCRPHWNELRAAITARGLDHLVARDGAAAAAQVADELTTGSARDREGFDPLLRAWSMIAGRALEMGSGLMGCPLCFVQHHHDTCTQPDCLKPLPAEWIGGCTDSLAEYARELGLTRPRPAGGAKG